MRKYIGEIGLTITAIIWGSGFVASAIALEHWSAYQILAGRFLIGALVLSLLFYQKLRLTRKSTIMKGAVLGLLLYLAFALQTVGLQYTTPSKNAFITAVNVVIVPFIGYLLYKKRLDKFELTGALLAVVGVGVLSLQRAAEINIGDLLTLACAFAFAFHIFYTGKFVEDESPVLLTLIQMAVAAAMALLVVLFRGELHTSVEREGMMALVYLGIFSTTIAFLFQTAAQQFTTETNAAIILSTEAFWGMLLSVSLLGEALTMKMITGAFLILSAILISETKLTFINKKTNMG